MEMRSDICVARLSITVDPQDGSYMPSKVRLSVGDSFERIKEYKTLNVQLRGGEAGEMVLLQDIREVSDLSVSVNSVIVSVLLVRDVHVHHTAKIVSIFFARFQHKYGVCFIFIFGYCCRITAAFLRFFSSVSVSPSQLHSSGANSQKW